MRDQIVAEANGTFIDAIKAVPVDIVRDGWRKLLWVREPAKDVFECQGFRNVQYGRDHWMVTRLGTAAGAYVWPSCSGRDAKTMGTSVDNANFELTPFAPLGRGYLFWAVFPGLRPWAFTVCPFGAVMSYCLLAVDPWQASWPAQSRTVVVSWPVDP